MLVRDTYTDYEYDSNSEDGLDKNRIEKLDEYIENLVSNLNSDKRIKLRDAILIAKSSDEVSYIVSKLNDMKVNIRGMEKTLNDYEIIGYYDCLATDKNKKLDYNDQNYDPLGLKKEMSKEEKNALINKFNNELLRKLKSIPIENYKERNKVLDQLICGNMRMVRTLFYEFLRKHPNAYRDTSLELDDYLQEGREVIVKCATKFDLSKGTQFSTYLFPSLAGSFIRKYEEAAYKRFLCKGGFKLYSLIKSLEYSSNGEKMSDQEISDKLEITCDRVRFIKRFGKNYEETKLLIKDGEEPDYDKKIEQYSKDDNMFVHNGIVEEIKEDYIEDRDSESTIEIVEKYALKESVEKVLLTLTDREADVLRMRFGLLDGIPKTLEEAGKEFEVTAARIRTIEEKALRKLRHPSRSESLKTFLD